MSVDLRFRHFVAFKIGKGLPFSFWGPETEFSRLTGSHSGCYTDNHGRLQERSKGDRATEPTTLIENEEIRAVDEPGSIGGKAIDNNDGGERGGKGQDPGSSEGMEKFSLMKFR